MKIKQNIRVGLAILVFTSVTSLVYGEDVKDATSLTKDLLLDTTIPKPAATRSLGGDDRGIDVVRIDDDNTGTGRTALDVRFAYDSAELTSSAKHHLNQLATALNSKDLSNFTFEIIGHTDAVGSDEYNMGLSKRRALSVVKYLYSVHRVDGSRLFASGKGESELADWNNPRSGVNRRVEVRNISSL